MNAFLLISDSKLDKEKAGLPQLTAFTEAALPQVSQELVLWNLPAGLN